MADAGPYARLMRLITPHVADVSGLWSAGEEGTFRVAGGGEIEPPTAGLVEHDLWAGDRDATWKHFDPGSALFTPQLLALALPEAELWLIAEREDGRPGFSTDDIEWLQEATALAGQAFQTTQLSERLLEARATADGAAHRWATVARVSGQLARTVELDETIDAVLRSLVPYLADCALIDIMHPEAAPRRFARHLFGKWRESPFSRRRFPFGDTPVPQAIESLDDGGTYVSRWADSMAGPFIPSGQGEKVERLGPRSLAIVPLSIGESKGGALTLISAESEQEYGPNDLDLFRQVALQIGLALTTAISFAEVRNARREREEVLALVSHDLKNPLNVLRFAASLLTTPGLPDDRKAQQVQVIERAVEQMDELINSLLDASRIDAGRFSVNPTAVPAEVVAHEAVVQVQPLAEREGIDVHLEMEPELPFIHADRQRLLRVFGNLLSNAISFTPAGRGVHIGARVVPEGVCFEVRDHGPGMDSEALAHVFDRYWQARKSGNAGAGLGLTIARGIVRAHGGSIDVESEVGVGTTFRFTIPLAPRAEAHSRHLES